jgi:hypothetical protein
MCDQLQSRQRNLSRYIPGFTQVLFAYFRLTSAVTVYQIGSKSVQRIELLPEAFALRGGSADYVCYATPEQLHQTFTFLA